MGGNLIPVKYAPAGSIKNLHSLWDTAVGSFTDRFSLPLDEEAVKTIDQHVNDLVSEFPEDFFGEMVTSLNVNSWAEESFQIAQEFAYSDIDIFPTLRAQYLNKGREIARKRVALAGYRLFYVLEDLFNSLATDF